MINEELNDYIKNEFKKGSSGESVFNDLISEGWASEDIIDNIDANFFEIKDGSIILRKSDSDETSGSIKVKTKGFFSQKLLLFTVFLLILFSLGTWYYFFLEKNEAEVRVGPVDVVVNDVAIKQNPEDIKERLNKIADDIEQKGSFAFKRISGEGGFVLGSGEVILPDKIRETKYGGIDDVYFVKQQDSPDTTILEYFPSDKFDYLGGFGDYVAFAEKGEDSIGYYESIQTKTNPDNFFFRILENPVLANENPDIIGVWTDGSSSEDIVLNESLSPSLPLYVPGILRSAASNTIKVSNVESNTVIRYFANSETLTKFRVPGFSSWTERGGVLNENIFFDVTVTVSAEHELKDIVVEVFSLDQDRTEAYKISFDSFGDVYGIDTPVDKIKTPYSLEEVVLPKVKPLDVKISSEVRNVSSLPPIKNKTNETEGGMIEDEDRVLENMGNYARLLVQDNAGSEIHVYDKNGGHTGSIKPPFVGGRNMEEGAVLARSRSIGGSKTVGIDLGGECDYYPEEIEEECIPEAYFLVVINATDKNEGLLHFNIDNGQGDDLSDMYLKATKKSRGTMEVTRFNEDVVFEKLRYDYDGDGVTDYELSHNSSVPAEIEFVFSDFETQEVSEDVFKEL